MKQILQTRLIVNTDYRDFQQQVGEAIDSIQLVGHEAIVHFQSDGSIFTVLIEEVKYN